MDSCSCSVGKKWKKKKMINKYFSSELQDIITLRRDSRTIYHVYVHTHTYTQEGVIRLLI